MKYLKKYKLFLEKDEKIDIEEDIWSEDTDTEDSTPSEMLNDLKDQIDEFTSKRINLENLVIRNVDTDKDISKNIEQIVGDNKFLAIYLSIVNKMATVKKLENKIDYYDQVKSEREGDLNSVSKLSNEEERLEQTQKLQNDLKDVSEKSKDMEDQIKDLNKEIADEQKQFKNYIKNKEDEFKDNIKKIEKEKS